MRIDNSQCSRAILCDFTIDKTTVTHQVEHCVFCGKRLRYRIIDGKIDNIQYGRDHQRDILQAVGRSAALFKRIYGIKAYRKLKGAYREISWSSEEERQQKYEEIRREAAHDVSTYYI